MNSHTNLNISIRNVKFVNPQLSSCDIYVMSKEEEANGTYFSEEVIIKALPSIIGIPIVAEYSEEIEDFKGHGGEFDKDLQFKHTTKPYGFIPESTEIEWVTTIKGEKYIVLRNCVLWTGRYKEVLSVIEEGKSQSMEIIINEGHWDDEMDCYMVDDFIFSALCILGDYTTPAFSGAKIIKGSSNFENDTFKMEFAKMLEEIKDVFKGSEKMEEVIETNIVSTDETPTEEIFEEVVVTEETVTEEATTEETVETVEEAEEVFEEVVVTEETVEVIEEVIEESVEEAIQESTEDTSEFSEEQEFDYKLAYENLLVEFESFKTQNVTYENELSELREYKSTNEKLKHEAKANEIFEKFELSTDEVSHLDLAKYSLEEIEEKCYAIIGKKLASKSINFSQEKNIYKLNNSEQKSDDVYGEIFSKYKK